jgi:large subunit ribosomal protein L31
MKATGHPTWYKDAKIVCACGNNFTAGSTVPEIRVELCAKCHPFFTGQQKLVDTQGQVEKFTQKISTAQVKKQERAQIEARRSERVQTSSDKPTLKDLLMATRRNKAA